MQTSGNLSAVVEQAEQARLADLARLDVLDSLPEPVFDNLARLASIICGTPIALISLVDTHRQWFKSRVGLDAPETARDLAFCAHAIDDPEQVMVVPDATQDARFVSNALVTGEPGIRFYAGAPIITATGHAIGTVCVIDRRARQLAPHEEEALKSLASLVSSMLEDRKRLLVYAGVSADAATAAVERARIIQAVTAQSPDLKAFIDRDYRWQYVNDTYLTHWDMRREDIEGKSMLEVLGEDMFYNVVKPQVDQAFAGNEATFERTFHFPKLGPIPVEVKYAPVYDDAREVIGAVARASNIREQIEREEALIKTADALRQKSLEEQRFIHIVSHDLKEPVNTIKNYASLLQDQLQTQADPVPRYLQRVLTAGKRLGSLLDQLGQFVQLEGSSLHKTEVDLNALMASVADDLRVTLELKHARLEWRALPVVFADSALLEVAICNLVKNALKFARAEVPPVVRVTAKSDAREVAIIVEDNGIGIPSDQYANIFEVFRRLHARKVFEGSGLGLSNCRRIAELHGGRVEVVSELGQGSRFSLVLPQASSVHSQE